MNSISAISPVWGVPSPTAGEGTVFKRTSQDSEKPNASADVRADPSKTQDSEPGSRGASTKAGKAKLKPAEERQVAELAQRDRQVRAHEAAHQAAAGSLGGAASFTYQMGPDGKSYAVGGEVPVDMSGGRTPGETIARAQQVRAAALAPADPSPQDLAVAAEASAIEALARQQLSAQQRADGLAAEARRKGAGQREEAAPEVAPRPPVRDSGEGPTPRPSAPASASETTPPLPRSPADPVPDVAAKAAAAVAAVQASRGPGPGSAQLQQIARLAAFAYSKQSGVIG